MGILKRVASVCLIFTMSLSAIACSKSKEVIEEKVEVTNTEYNGRVFYEIFVRAFNDSNGDGIGDLNGVTEKLDYLKDLGIGGIWLMPIHESPSYHGYDVTDYKSINSEYGTMADFENLIKEADNRDIKIYMDMVINHTSKEHNWFKEGLASTESEYRDYYLWSNDSSVENEVSPMGTKPWIKTEAPNEYYYGIFTGDMPDLNLDNESVKNELKDIAKFYIDKGVDGFRLDAVKWFYNEDEANNKFIKEYSEYCKSLDEDFILLGEVWDNTYAMAKYQESLDSFFDFSLGDLVIEGINNKRIERLPEAIKRNFDAYTNLNKDFVPAPFLSNHDQTRIMNSLGRSDDSMKIAATIYLTLPGTPFIYYGEETGMLGKKPDEMIREPFVWDSEDMTKNTSWREITNDVQKVGLDKQVSDDDSIYNFYKKIINIRNNNDVLKYGDIGFIRTDVKEVMIMERTFNGEIAYVIINSSAREKTVEVENGEEKKLKEGDYKVIFSNLDKTKLNIESKLNLEGNEILILTK